MYKLINKTTNKEIVCTKVVVDGFDYYVNNNEVLVNTIYYNVATNSLITMCEEGKDREEFDSNLKKLHLNIIATNSPNIDLRQIIDEIEELAKIDANLVWNNETTLKNEQKELNGHIIGFKEGYNKSQEIHPYSVKDMIEFAKWSNRKEDKSKKELLQLWKEQQLKTLYYI